MSRMLLSVLVVAAAVVFFAPLPAHAQPAPYLWMVHLVTYPNGTPVPAANLSFDSWLKKVSGGQTAEIVTELNEGSGVLDSDPQIYVECSTFGDYSNAATWWTAGDTVYCRIFAANDPGTGLTDSVTIWDVLEPVVGTPYQYYDDTTVPIPVELMAFSAERQGSDVVLSWTVARELDNLGFYVQRSGSAEGIFTRISDLIPGRGTADQEATYSWIDDAPQGQVVFYMLEDVDYQGESTVHGPVRVVVGGSTTWGAIKAAFAE